MKKLIVAVALAATAVLTRKLAARSNTQVHRINQRSHP
jgi:hypothetical protein